MPEDALLNWGDVFGWGAASVLAVGGLAVVAIGRRPSWFWPLLVLGTIVGNGPRVKGYFLLDEVVTACVVLGCLAYLALRSRPGATAAPARVHRALFTLWMAYMVIQSVRGVVVGGDPRLMRWAVLYAILGILPMLMARREFSPPAPRGLAAMIVAGALAYYAAYLGLGVAAEALVGQWERFAMQDYLWAGSAYAVFPTAVAMPAAIMLIGDRARGWRLAAYTAVLLMAAVAFYFDSRVSWLVIAAFLGVSVGGLRLRRLATFVVLVGLVLVALMPAPAEKIEGFVDELVESAQALRKPGESDVTRNLQLRAALLTMDAVLATDLSRFFFGHGVYGHRSAIAPQIRELYDQYLDVEFVQRSALAPGGGVLDVSVGETYRTTGFGALLIDTGLVGMLLLLANAVAALVGALGSPSPHRTVLAATVVVGLAWLLVANIADIVLFYLLLMPSGVVARLAAQGAADERSPMARSAPALPLGPSRAGAAG